MLSGVPPKLPGMAEHPEPEYMSAQALATHLGVTERTVRRWIERKKLDGVKRGRSFVIRREDGERLRLGGLSQVVDERSSLANVLAEREHALALLQGRYDELKERNQRLEAVLQEEHHRAALAEARLELFKGAQSVGPTRAAAA
jgi:excisionase family DNA binding protein